MTTVWARIRRAATENGYRVTQTDIAKRLGIKQASVSEWNTLRGAPKLEHARILATDLGVTIDWLLNGTEPMRTPPSDDPVAQRLVNLWPRLSAFTRGRILQIAEDSLGPVVPNTNTSPSLAQAHRQVAKDRAAARWTGNPPSNGTSSVRRK